MKLGELLFRRGQTFTDLANAVGVAPQSISRIAAGKRRPSLALAQRIARALHARLRIVGTDFTFVQECCPDRNPSPLNRRGKETIETKAGK